MWYNSANKQEPADQIQQLDISTRFDQAGDDFLQGQQIDDFIGFHGGLPFQLFLLMIKL